MRPYRIRSIVKTDYYGPERCYVVEYRIRFLGMNLWKTWRNAHLDRQTFYSAAYAESAWKQYLADKAHAAAMKKQHHNKIVKEVN